MEERDEVGDRRAFRIHRVVVVGGGERVGEGRFHLREEVEERRLEALVPVVGDDEVAEAHQDVDVAAKPERVALVEGEGEVGRHRVARHAGDLLDDGDEALVLEDLAVAVDVVVELAEVEPELHLGADADQRLLGEARSRREAGDAGAWKSAKVIGSGFGFCGTGSRRIGKRNERGVFRP